jgi:hypothetical protein
MANNIRKLGILIAFGAVLLLGIVLVTFSHTHVGTADDVGVGVTKLAVPNVSAVPQSVAKDAAKLAKELFGDYHEKHERFATELLSMYAAAKDKDFVVIFNSGGWGWNFLDSSPGWRTIFMGIKSELEELGYNALMLNYRRTDESVRGTIDEFVEVIRTYPSKAENLASRVEFLTNHIPDLNVIITGESNGTIFTDSTMNILRHNQHVYSIQTGIPFWHENVMWERTLVLNSNGMMPDAFAEGDIPKIASASLRAMVGLPQPEPEERGRILYFLRAPGHDYWWRYPHVYTQITDFLDINFGNGQG